MFTAETARAASAAQKQKYAGNLAQWGKAGMEASRTRLGTDDRGRWQIHIVGGKAAAARYDGILAKMPPAARRRIRERNALGSYSASEWAALKLQFGRRCVRCKAVESTSLLLTPDHITSLACGGRNDISNIQPLCWPCNRIKGARCQDFRLDGWEQLRLWNF